jgi:nucleotide-binding universal stress UspA family protein
MRVIVGIDGSEQQPDALALGAQLAQAEDGRLTLAHVYPWSRWSVRLGTAYEMTMRDDAESLLRGAKAALGEIPCSVHAVADLSPARGLHRLAEDEDADVLVVASSHRGAVGRTLIGGSGDRILHGAPCSVAVAPRGYADAERAVRRVGVAYDASPAAGDALSWATRFAETVGASLTLFTVVEPIALSIGYAGGMPYDVEELEKPYREECRRHLDEAIAQLPPAVDATGTLLHGSAAHALATAAADVDVLVSGSRDYGPVRSVLVGSVAHALLHQCPSPLIVVPRTTVDDGAEAPPRDSRVAAAG